MPMPRLTGRGPRWAVGAASSQTARHRCGARRPARANLRYPLRIDLVAQRDGVHANALGELVEGLFEREDALHLSGRAEGRAWAGIGEHVVMLGRIRWGRGTSSRGRSRRPRQLPRRRCHSFRAVIAVSVPSRLAPTFRRWRLLGRLPTETCSSRRSSIKRTGAPALRERWMASMPKLPMPYLAPNPPPVKSLITRTLLLRQIEDLGGLVAHAGGELGGGIDGQPVLAPVGDNAVRLHGHVRLHLGAVFRFDHDIGLAQALVDVAARQPILAVSGPRTLPCCGRPGAAPPPPAVAACSVGPGKTAGASFLHRFVERGDVGQRLVVDFDEPCRRLGGTLRFCRHRRQRLARIAHGGVAVACLGLRIAQLRRARCAPAHAPHARRGTSRPPRCRWM